MAEPQLVNYYAVLNLPTQADLLGIENAYARLSDDLAAKLEIDETAGEALRRLNEAYSVLSKPELRREYDRVFLSKEFQELERKLRADVRRRNMVARLLVGTLVGMVLIEAVGLAYFAGLL